MIHASNSLVRWREILERSAGTFQCRAELRVSFFKVRSALYRDTQRSYFERTRRWTTCHMRLGRSVSVHLLGPMVIRWFPRTYGRRTKKWCNGRYSTGTSRKALQLTETLGWETGIENAPKLEYNNLQSVGTL